MPGLKLNALNVLLYIKENTKLFFSVDILGSDRTGLVFTRSQEGTQPGGLTQADQTEQGILYQVPSCFVPVEGELGGRNSLAAREHTAAAAVGERGSVRSYCLCCVFSLSVSLLLLFPLFTVLLNCPYPDPPVFSCFFPFSSAPQQGERRPCGVFIACHNQTITVYNTVELVSSIMAKIPVLSQSHYRMNILFDYRNRVSVP